MSGWKKNPAGVKDGADCYRTIGGLRWSWWSECPAVFKAGGIRHRSAPGGDGSFVHPDDEELAERAISVFYGRAHLKLSTPSPEIERLGGVGV